MVRHIRRYRPGKEKIHMIYDKRAELARYFGLSPNLDAAIRFLQTTDLTALPMGRTEIPGGDIYYNHFTYTTALISQSSLFEAHERYLDLHIVLSGCEQVALAPVESLDEAEVRADEDSTMYRGTPEYSVTLDQNRFLLVFPGEGHLPKLSDSVPMNIDKLVLKIPC